MCHKCGLPDHVDFSEITTSSNSTKLLRRNLLAAGAVLSAMPIVGMGESAHAQAASQSGGIPSRGYAADALNSPLKPYSFTRRNLRADDVLIDIQWAGICHSDIHTLNGDWGPLAYQMVPGHEIIGRVSAVGSSVFRFKVGD